MRQQQHARLKRGERREVVQKLFHHPLGIRRIVHHITVCIHSRRSPMLPVRVLPLVPELALELVPMLALMLAVAAGMWWRRLACCRLGRGRQYRISLGGCLERLKVPSGVWVGYGYLYGVCVCYNRRCTWSARLLARPTSTGWIWIPAGCTEHNIMVCAV